MSSPDLTEAVDASAQAMYAKGSPHFAPWEETGPMTQWSFRQQALDWIAPAAQLIYDQGRAAGHAEGRAEAENEAWLQDPLFDWTGDGEDG